MLGIERTQQVPYKRRGKEVDNKSQMFVADSRRPIFVNSLAITCVPSHTIARSYRYIMVARMCRQASQANTYTHTHVHTYARRVGTGAGNSVRNVA